jgi:outer membrane protein assembly factor BamB
MFWTGSKQFVYGAATLAMLVVLAVGLVLYFQDVGQPGAGLTSAEAMYKGGPQRTGVYDVRGPKLGELKWKFATEGQMWAGPTVADGVAYVGSMDGYLYAVDSQTGGELWKFEASHPVISTPAVADRTVYFGSGCVGRLCLRRPDSDYYFYALDSQTGQEKWRFKTRGGVATSPLIADGVVYFGSEDQHLYAVDRQTGQELWNFDTGHAFGKHLYAVDSQTGQQLWRFETGGWVESTPALADGVVYFGSGDSHVYAVDARTGQENWRFERVGTVREGLAVGDGVVYAGGGDGRLSAIDSQTGQELWNFDAGHAFTTPAIVDGMIYFGSDDFHLYALEGQTGEELWKFQASGQVFGPTVADGMVYFGSEVGNLYAVGDPGQ